MAIWQFKFTLVPANGIVAVHGVVPMYIRDYQPPADVTDTHEAAPMFADYWKSGGTSPKSLPEISQLLPVHRSWSSEAEMYGSSDGDRIEVWKDDIHCLLDMRKFSEELLRQILAIASKSGCKVVVDGTGEVVDPDMSAVMNKVRESGAYEFCTSPAEYLKKRRSN